MGVLGAKGSGSGSRFLVSIIQRSLAAPQPPYLRPSELYPPEEARELSHDQRSEWECGNSRTWFPLPLFRGTNLAPEIKTEGARGAQGEPGVLWA